MKNFVLALLAGLVTSSIGLPSVIHFAVEKEDFAPATKVGSYEFKNCAPADSEKFTINSLSIGPDPLSFPGTLSIAFNGIIKDTVDAPLKASVYIGKKVGSTWIKIPCIGSIGSCTYDDLCSYLDNVQCPDPLVAAGIPCKCPFKTGNYTLPTANFDIGSALFPAGDYRAQANLTVNDALVSCAEIMVTFE